MHVNGGDFRLLHRKFCKMMLNVPSSVTNVTVNELDRMPMYLCREVLMIKYWPYVLTITILPFYGIVTIITNSTLQYG